MSHLYDDAYLRGVAIGFPAGDSRRETLLRIADSVQRAQPDALKTMITALADIDASLGIPTNGRSGTEQALAEIRRLQNRIVELENAAQIRAAAELACGLLWMSDWRRDKANFAFVALRDALGGPGSKGLGDAIQRAIDAGYEADHPPEYEWWAGMKLEPE